MGNKKKPNLAGIQEFGAAAYVKDLSAGKLDTRAKKGRFVGYDSESKGYQIYWPEKKSISVEHNIVFNQEDTDTSDDTTIISGEAQSEGEKEKIIQAPQNETTNVEPENRQPEDQRSTDKQPEPHPDQDFSNSVPLPSSNEPDPEPHKDDEPPNQQYGRGQRARPQKGHYKAMNEGLVAAIAPFVEEIVDDDEPTETIDEVPEEPNDYIDDQDDDAFDLPPDIALAGHYATDPSTLDEALRGPDAKEWQKALEYEISQLEKLGTWVVVDLPEGQTAIPCSEITRVKRGLMERSKVTESG